MTLQNDDFKKFLVSLWGTHLSGIFTSPICFKCRMTVEWLILSSLATSHIVVRALMIALNWLLSTSYGWPLHFLSSRLSYTLQNFLNHHCTVCSQFLGQMSLLILQVVSLALQPILNSKKKKKIAGICFLSDINSIV